MDSLCASKRSPLSLLEISRRRALAPMPEPVRAAHGYLYRHIVADKGVIHDSSEYMLFTSSNGRPFLENSVFKIARAMSIVCVCYVRMGEDPENWYD